MTTHNKTLLVLISIVVACITFAMLVTIAGDLLAPRRLPNGELEPSNIVNSWSAFVPVAFVYLFFAVWMLRGWRSLLRERRQSSLHRPSAVSPAAVDAVAPAPAPAGAKTGQASAKWKNTWYVLRQWLLPLPIAAIMLYALAARLLIGDYVSVTVVVAVVAAIIGLVVYSTRNRMHRMLQADSPQPLVDYFESSLQMSPIPHADVSRAFSKALAYTLYGQFAKAKLEMRSMDLAGRPPLVQSQPKFLEAWWAYLERHDYPAGLALAREARSLCSVPYVFPGAGITMGAYDAAVAIGELMSGSTDPKLLAALEKKLNKQPTLQKVMVAWALERAYRQSQRLDDAQKMRALINDLAPHCRGLAKAP